jgi:hypothetical protein
MERLNNGSPEVAEGENKNGKSPGSIVTPEGAADRKRMEARRRFLVGGAAALPVVISAGNARAAERVTTLSKCTSLGGEPVGMPLPPPAPGEDPDYPTPGPSLNCKF